MKLLRLLLVISSLSSLTPIAYATQPTPPNTTFSDPTKSIMVSQDQPTFTIRLQSYPTTGYSWFIKDYNTNLLVLQKHQYTPPTQKIPGAGGYETWQFKVKPEAFIAPSVLTIQLIYARPWEMHSEGQTESQNAPHATTFYVVTH